MYWYPFAEEEEEKAVAQAQAQAEAVGRNKDDLRKFVGNLGELAVEQFFGQFVADQCWEYLNAEAIDNAEPEYSRSDFRIMGMDVDIKSTTDIRKFDPIRMSRRDANWPSTTGYPEVDFAEVVNIALNA